MDTSPNQLIRLLQLGQTEHALRAAAIWQCVSCQTCSARCPKNVDCAGILDALRELSRERGLPSPESERIVIFQQAFLDNIRRNGRLDEIELTVVFKQRSFLRDGNLGLLMKDAGLAPALMRLKKFHLRGQKPKDRAVVGRIFARCPGGAQ